MITPGNTADCTVAPDCVSALPGVKELIADKGYDSEAFRRFLKSQGITPVIPGRSNRKKKIRYKKKTYKKRNTVERSHCHTKDARRIATRYDKLAQSFLSALCFVVLLTHWL